MSSAVREIERGTPPHSPAPSADPVPFLSKPMVSQQAPNPPPCPPGVPQDTGIWERCSTFMSIVSAHYSGIGLPAGHCALSGSMPEGWLLWKLPNAKEERQCYSNIIRFEISDTSALHSLSLETVSALCRPKPFAHQVVSSTGTALDCSTEWSTWLLTEPLSLLGWKDDK